MRGQKGITLVALIITIVVLMILAVVSITAVQNNDIFTKAQNAADKYTNESEKEQNFLDNSSAILQNYYDKMNS